MINKLYGIERVLKEMTDEQRFAGRQEQSLPVLVQLKSWLEKTQPQVTVQSALGTVMKFNRKTVTVETDTDQRWNISPHLLSPIKNVQAGDGGGYRAEKMK